LGTSEIFSPEKRGAERDDFDFLIFFAKKSKNQNHLSPKVFFNPFGEIRFPKFPVFIKKKPKLSSFWLEKQLLEQKV
jgi:hypothetical protein